MESGGYYLVFVKPGDTLSAIVRDTLGPFRTHDQWMRVVREVAQRSAIADPDRIFPGQPVVLRPVSMSSVCESPIPPGEIEQLRSIWKATPPAAREVVEQSWDLLDWINLGNNGVGGLAGAGVALAQVELSQLRPPPPRVQIVLRQQIQHFSERLILLRNRTLTILRREGIVRTVRPVIRLVPDAAGQARYAAKLRALTTTARSLRWTGRASLALSLGLAGYGVYQDWDTPERYRTLSSQGAGVGAAMAGGAAGYTACNVVLGFPTGGNSLWICALLVGGAAGAVFGEGGAAAGEILYDLATGNGRPARDEPEPAWILERVPLGSLR